MWQRAIFRVPSNIKIERIIEKAPKFAKIFVETREKEGWRLASRVWLNPFPKKVEDQPDLDEYSVWAKFTRRPVTRITEIPENPNLIKILEEKYGGRIA